VSSELRELRFEIELARRLLRKQLARDFLHPIVDQSLGAIIPSSSGHKLNAELRDDVESDDSMVLKNELERLKQLTSKLVVRNSGAINPLRFPTVAFTDGCTDCVKAPLIWQMTMTGVTDGSCDECDTLNKTYNFIDQGPTFSQANFETGCIWKAEPVFPCGQPAGSSPTFGRNTAPSLLDSWVILFIGVLGLELYWIDDSDFDCLGSNEMIGLFDPASELCNLDDTVCLHPSTQSASCA